VESVWGRPVPRAALKHPFTVAFTAAEKQAAVEVKAHEAEGRHSRVQLRVKTGRQVQLGGEVSYVSVAHRAVKRHAKRYGVMGRAWLGRC
jgi:23S rRNA-/tRNA-specific pseudouridylate synthase